METSLFDAAANAAPCGGFAIAFLDDGPRLSFLPGARDLPAGLVQAVWTGLAEAPEYLTRAIGLRPPARPYREVQVLLTEGAAVLGEARGLGSGQIRLWAGAAADPSTVRALARHEALHLLLASNLGAGARWNDPELAFADWIVRGIETMHEPGLTRFRAPDPLILEQLPTSRDDVLRRLHRVAAAPGEGARVFGPELLAALQRTSHTISADARDHAQLRLVEAALGTHYLEEAARLGGAARLRPLLLDDWLLDYESYAQAIGNAPSGAGSLWRLSQAGWSAEPLVRLSAAAQSLQLHDGAWFTGARWQPEDEPLVWKNRGRIRVPLVAGPKMARPHPLLGFRAALRECPHELAQRCLEEAAAGAETFEAGALWPRILARLMTANLPPPRAEPEAIARAQIVAGPGAAEALHVWSEARSRLAQLCPDSAPWIPQVLAPRSLEELAELEHAGKGSLLLVHGAKIDATRLARSRKLAATLPVRGAMFLGKPTQVAQEVAKLLARLPDLAAPLDPRYREGAWSEAPLPARLSALADIADAGTRDGSVSTALSHLLSATGLGVEECLYPQA